MKERFFIYVTEKGKEALEKIYAFNEGKLKKRDIASDLLVEEAKKYKGRKSARKASVKTEKKGR